MLSREVEIGEREGQGVEKMGGIRGGQFRVDLGFVTAVRCAVYSRRRTVRLCSGAVESRDVPLATGVSVEVRSAGSGDRMLLFVHGSFHSAWCWDNFLRFFAERGFHAHAVSLRGSSKSPSPERSVPKLMDHVEDLRSIVDVISPAAPPVIVSHSLGGVIVMKYLEAENPAGFVAFFGSIPPSGNSAMVQRFVKTRGWLVTWRIIRGLALKAVKADSALARTLFFTAEDPDDLVLRAVDRFREDSNAIIDLRDAMKHLPSNALPQGSRTAPWLHR